MKPAIQAWRRGQIRPGYRLNCEDRHRCSDRSACEDRGAGTVLMLAVIVVAMSVLALGTAGGRLVIAEHRVRSAADLAALAGAGALATGGDGCATAARAAAANGTGLEQCATEPGGVITVRLRALSGISGWVARSAARAGPAPVRAGRAGLGQLGAPPEPYS